jgi:hypothetical protein
MIDPTLGPDLAEPNRFNRTSVQKVAQCIVSPFVIDDDKAQLPKTTKRYSPRRKLNSNKSFITKAGSEP